MSDDEALQIVVDLLSQCRRGCKVEVNCINCFSERLAPARTRCGTNK
jgi:hypothetical protein